ncbi:hypothetical protein GCM10007963_05540 [Lutibacter litoralis]|nr:hypothetical protein GCM10007963_05540 [Lutibacter litoralis]
MKSSVKTTVNFGLVNWFKNTKLYKWLGKKKLFFIRSVAHSNNPPLLRLSDKEKSEVFEEFKLHSKYFKLFIESGHFIVMFKQLMVSEYFLFKNEIIQILKVDEKYSRGEYKDIEEYNLALEKAKKSYDNACKLFLENHPKKTGIIQTKLN